MNFLCGFGELNHHDSIIPPSGLKSGGRTAGRSFLEVFRHNAVCCEIAERREIVHESFKLCLCLPIPLFGPRDI